MSEYVGYYDKELKEFFFSKESKALSDELGVEFSLIKEVSTSKQNIFFESNKYIIGKATYVRSRRGVQ